VGRWPNHGLFSAQKSNACGERAAINCAEGQEIRRVNDSIHEQGVLVIGDVIEAAPDGPVESGCVKTFLQVEIEAEPGRKAARSRGLNELQL